MSRDHAPLAQNSSGVIFPRGRLRANSNAIPIIERSRPSVNAGEFPNVAPTQSFPREAGIQKVFAHHAAPMVKR